LFVPYDMTEKSWLQQAHQFRESGITLTPAFRKEQLQILENAIRINEKAILEALRLDLGKGEIEAYASEIGFVLADIHYALKHLADWTRPERRHTPLGLRPASSSLHRQPYGVVLVIGPWNYPFALTFSPLVSAMAAGNSVCLKPSEEAPHTAKVIQGIIREHFNTDYLTVIEGDAAIAESLVHLPFDKIFFTGSTAVGRRVMAAAAKTLTPVTLELGGKSPCIICADADLPLAAHRIAWGKFLNAGQTCVAPDHVWVQRDRLRPWIDHLTRTIRQFYGADARQSPDYGRIVNRRHLSRLTGYLGQGRIECGGQHDESQLYLAPTVMTDIPLGAPVMQEEIFGPILPVMPFDTLDEVVTHLRPRPRPLALYAFTNNPATRTRLLSETVSGGVCFNDTVSHLLGRDLPFGGIGASGMGAYHGKTGFDTFTHYRSVLTRSSCFESRFVYPPMAIQLATLKRFYRFLMGS
jgi:aldehyde dehydrogenase (NAD+)